MKKKLLSLYGGVLAALFMSNSATAQLDYFENFEGTISWTGTEFHGSDEVACEGDTSFVVNLYGGFVGNTSSETVSPSIGTSDGAEVTLSYEYKVVEATDLTEPVQNSSDWGNFTISYGTSASGPFTTLETISPTNHDESATCATRTVSFTPSNGSQVYLKIFGQMTAQFANFYLYFDNIQVAGDLGNGGFKNDKFSYYPNPVEGTLNLSYINDLSSVEIYDLLGQCVVNKVLSQNAAQVDMSALSAGSYLVKVTSGNASKTIKVMKQ